MGMPEMWESMGTVGYGMQELQAYCIEESNLLDKR
jgi:hypothetical protein